MCGIVGGIGWDVDRLNAGLATLRHRGPDAAGTWWSPDKRVGVGQARLSILDLAERANQPMLCPRTGNVIVFNGEIFNFRALRRELQSLGWEFRTTSDTEVLLAAYGQWGEACLRELNGMWAFAIYDPTRRVVFLSRDRVGKKPLYLTTHGGRLAWASEIKALLAGVPGLPRDVDDAALRAFMDLGYIPGEASIYASIRKLPPAHCAVYDLNTAALTTRRYWTLPDPDETAFASESAATDALEALLADAIQIRLESDVPVGAFLSGGLDSSLIAAMTARQTGPGLVAYTAQFPVQKYDETATARGLTRQLGIEHRVLPIGDGDGDALSFLAGIFDEPFADSSLLPTYLVSRAIREHVTVALSGDGGDELFAGYDSYALTCADNRRFERVPQPVRTFAAPLHHALPVGTPGKNLLRRLPHNGIARFLNTTLAPEHAAVNPLRPEVEARLRTHPADAHRRALLAEMEPDLSLIQKMTRLDFGSFLCDDVLVKVDRASMATSLEVRAPLLDYRIVELAYRLPDALRLGPDGVRKNLLKRLARRYLPADFPIERKMGFNIPESEWFQGAWGARLAEIVAGGASRLLDAERIARLQEQHNRSGRQNRLLFKSLMLAQWESNYG